MVTAKVKSLSLPTSLLEAAEKYAATENRSVEELLAEAVERYIEVEPQYNALRRRGRKQGKLLGIRSEDDVQRICEEEPVEKRLRSA